MTWKGMYNTLTMMCIQYINNVYVIVKDHLAGFKCFNVHARVRPVH